jgi:PEGA domain
MKITKKQAVSVSLFCSIVFLAFTNCFGAELIEPTHTLREPEKAWGGLTIFSEPPQIEIYLDGEKVGLTPLWLREVETGPHTIKIGHAETSVRVDKDQRLKVGLFKGSFVISSESQKEKPKVEQNNQEVGLTPTPPRSEEERRHEDLSLWEKFINGTLKHF